LAGIATVDITLVKPVSSAPTTSFLLDVNFASSHNNNCYAGFKPEFAYCSNDIEMSNSSARALWPCHPTIAVHSTEQGNIATTLTPYPLGFY